MGKPGAGASIAANFLNAFVEEGTKWIHLDIAEQRTMMVLVQQEP